MSLLLAQCWAGRVWMETLAAQTVSDRSENIGGFLARVRDSPVRTFIAN